MICQNCIAAARLRGWLLREYTDDTPPSEAIDKDIVDKKVEIMYVCPKWEKSMSLVQRIIKYVSHLRKGTLLDAKCLERFCDRKTANTILSRLNAKGILMRVSKGVYHKPIDIVKFGLKRMPSPRKVIDFILRGDRRYDVRGIYGPLALNLLRISTQVSFRKAYYVEGPTKIITVGKTQYYFIHVPKVQLIHAGTDVGVAVSALFYLKRDEVTIDILRLISETLTKEDMQTLLETMKSKFPRWMGEIARKYEDVKNETYMEMIHVTDSAN